MAPHGEYTKVLCLLLQILLCHHGNGELLYIKPTMVTPCPGTPCYTLMQYVNSPSISLNVTLVMLPGNHNLETELSVMNNVSFSLLTYLNTSLSRVTCYSSGRLRFASIRFVKLSHVSFIGCGCNVAQSIDTFILQYSNFLNVSTSCSGGSWSVTSSTDVIINNCTFSNNHVSGSNRKGGAVYVNEANSNISRCTFTNNRVSGSYSQGGAVYISEANSTVSDSTFVNNQGNGSYSEGGAVYISKANSTISDSTFINNQGNGYYSEGGAMYISDADSTISNSTFINNQGNGYYSEGGAMYISDADSTISNSTFINNQGNGYYSEGGAVYISEANSTVSDSIFVSNQGNGSYSEGGAMYISEANSTVSNSIFINNQGNGYYSEGGAMYISDANSIIRNSTFINNQDNGYYSEGGAVYIIEANSTIRNSTFTDNKIIGSYSEGGALSITEANFTVSDSTFIDNQVSGSYSEGGAVYISEANSSIITSVFINNRVIGTYSKDGALYVELSTAHFSRNRGNIYHENLLKLSILESIFNSNTVALALYCYSRLYHTIGDSKIMVNRSSFTGNGVAIISSNIKNMNIHNSNFTNHAGTLAAIQFNGNRYTENHAVINKCNFTNNRRRAIYCNSIVSLVVNQSTFENNTSDNVEGVIYLTSGNYTNVTLLHSTFNNNSALACGVIGIDGIGNGSPSRVMHSAKINIVSSNFSHNSGSSQHLSGGVACFRNAEVTVRSSSFNHNSVNSDGGVFNLMRSMITIEKESVFFNNSAINHGGVAYITDSMITIKNSNFSFNIASTGGGVFSITNGNATIVDCTFSDNEASRSGGVLYVHSNPTSDHVLLNITNSRFSNNEAVTGGGILYASGNNFIDLVIESNCLSFSNNTPEFEGSFIAINNATISITAVNNEVMFDYSTGADILACNGVVSVQGNTSIDERSDSPAPTYCSECNCIIYNFLSDKETFPVCLPDFYDTEYYSTPPNDLTTSLQLSTVLKPVESDKGPRDSTVITSIGAAVVSVCVVLGAISVITVTVPVVVYRRRKSKSTQDAYLDQQRNHYDTISIYVITLVTDCYNNNNIIVITL